MAGFFYRALRQPNRMKRTPPPPLEIDWIAKPVSSARSGVDTLGDGRLYCWIEHEVIRNVTPAMLVWWFGHIDGDITVGGRSLKRYRVWHPLDHIAHRYLTRNADGSIGVGCLMHIEEMLGRQPEHLVDVLTVITRLDETGFAHRARRYRLPIVRMDYDFKAVEEGVLYRNSLTVGFEGRLGKLLNPLVHRAFNEAYAHAWIKHNIEEVGNFESFLPGLYTLEAGQAKKPSGAPE